MGERVQSRLSGKLINGFHTDICITPFEDRVLLVISQTATMGTMVQHCHGIAL